MSTFRTFIDTFGAGAAEAPQREALVLLSEGDQVETVSYGRLHALVSLLAGRIVAHTAPGDRVIILQSSRRLFTASFLACLYAGRVAVPVPPTGGRAHHDARLAGIVKDAAASCVLTAGAHAAEASQLLARTGFTQVTCLLADTAPGPADAPHTPPRPVGPDEVAYLQYTSGSTREPRGVMVTQRNLVANQEAIRRALDTGPASRFGGWLPLHHDMGLVGQLLHPLWLGTTTVLLTPQMFVKAPLRWLDAVSRHGLTVSGGPDFGYELCLRRINDLQLAGLDLTAWRTAVNGGEPVSPATAAAFADRFARAGLRPGALVPAYGLAEATLLVSAARPAHEGDRYTHCGEPADAEVRIVDPDTRAECAPGESGEIWVRGPGVAAGYWRRTRESADTFGARTADGDTTGTGFLRTGDLGVLDTAGRLRITGRLKEVMVVAGRNVHPHDVERTAAQAGGLLGAASVFAVTGGCEHVVLVQEVRARSQYDVDLDALATAVRARVAEEHDVRLGALLFVPSGTVRRTTSGKVERAAMRRMFLNGEFRPLHRQLDADVARLLPAGART
ncbi:fatty acyl-AMP ligase [Streptomyces candidus]|uniref:Acyl-CoA synthetase (AMP-forming)/AMP-acid ligase II n=1 Tax=Streptomyces candidus TaxID=67283 RepID=A0A7X0LPN6_9ACTN|nr:fatty acyl-AMP ligase [Streptomyces candidus]MBB6436708.1 acyl-CoA synthetase (AMP-forming)/AMP-acid ligase II [Streptomyces candidus]GHH51151.1 polyketide synthase [Streptomyces candidus]